MMSSHNQIILTVFLAGSTLWAGGSSSDVDDCHCVAPSRCADGGGVIKPRNKLECQTGLRYCCVVTSTDPPQCGLQNPTFIPGFQRAPHLAVFGQFPWHVKILGERGEFLGTGALVDEWRILTVAHIFQNSNASSVIVGGWNDAVQPLPFQTFEVPVHKTHTHPQFNPVNLFNDIAVLVLRRPLDLGTGNPQIGAICLPSHLHENTVCEVSTFGKDNFPIIHTIGVSTLRHYSCQDALRTTTLGDSFLLDKSFICASAESQDACKGHGGSPLACKINGKYELVGLVSWGLTNDECTDKGQYPGIYTNVHAFLDWLSKL